MTEVRTKLKIELYAIIPYFTFKYDDELYNSRFRMLIKEIIDTSDDKISIAEVDGLSSVNKFVDEERKVGLFSSKSVLKFTYLYEYLFDDICVNDQSNLDQRIAKILHQNKAVDFVYSRACNLITCVNIMLPGVLSVNKCIIFRDEKYLKSVDFFIYQNTVQEIESALPKKLFENSIQLTGILNWLEKINLNNNYTTTSLGRAVGALNRLLFSSLDESNAIMWALVAVEALYCHKNDIAITKQIIEKADLIDSLGCNSKDLKKMYDMRSDFLHGVADFPFYPQLATYQISGNEKQEVKVMQKSLHTAVELLVGTLQFMAVNDKLGLNFKRKYILE